MTISGDPTVACPLCNGPLSPDAEAVDWVCRVGHRFDVPLLADAQAEVASRTLWYSLRALEDRAIVSEYVLTDLDKDGQHVEAGRLRDRIAKDLAMVKELHDLIGLVGNEEPDDDERAAKEPPGEQSGSHS